MAEVPQLLVSPTEPKSLRAIGKTSLIPESYGVDVVWASRGGLWGVQRKEISDLLASRSDGRLAKELAQMGELEVAILLVEGDLVWTNDGMLMAGYTNVSRKQLAGMLWSARMRGAWVERSESLDQTIEMVGWLADWSRKERHSGLRGRPKPAGNWGHVSNREWAIHLLTGLDGIGPTTAESIYDHFGGIPMAWTVDEKQLMEVPGVGKLRAAALIRTLARMERDQ